MTDDFNWLDPAWSQQEVGPQLCRWKSSFNKFAIHLGYSNPQFESQFHCNIQSPGHDLVDRHLCSVVPWQEEK